jgi:hypothetical protein
MMKLLWKRDKHPEDASVQLDPMLTPPNGTPPKEREGHPHPMTPADTLAEEEIDFHTPTRNNNNNGEHHQALIACSLYKSLGPNIPTHVDGMGFSLDSNKPVIVICHGSMSWRNQMLLAHLAAGLQKRLECHTLRFDFTGNGHSTGAFQYANYDGEFHDLQTVLSFVQTKMKCRVACVIGHSKGAAAVLRTAHEQETQEDVDDDSSRRRRKIPCFVNLSGFFAVPHEYDVEKRYGATMARALKENGRIVLDPKGARECVMTIDDVQEQSRLDSSFVKNIKSAAALPRHSWFQG